MLNIINWPRVRAEKFHNFLPEAIRSYLKGRGIPATIIEGHLLGWNGERITIPIFGENRRKVLGFRYAKAPTDISETPEVISDPGLGVQLYGLDKLLRKPSRVAICDGEFNRLVLEANDFAAVSSTEGADAFLEGWLPYFEGVKQVFICFNRDRTGEAAAKSVQAILPRARIVKLPAGAVDLTDFFVFQEKTKLDLEILLANASMDENDPSDTAPTVREFQPLLKSVQRRAERLKKNVKLHDVVEQFAPLQARGKRLVAHCPFHDDRELSFNVYPATNTYACSVCGAKGDVVQFVMDKESMSFSEALDALERFEFTHEIYGTG